MGRWTGIPVSKLMEGERDKLLRLEDIDPQRSRPELAAAALEDLRWLGLDWDAGPDLGGPHAPYVQSLRTDLYAAALARLEAQGLTYPCFCSRRELRQLAAAPHVDDRGAPYPGTCRRLSAAQRQALLAQGRHAALRLRCPPESISFVDAVQGPQCFTLADCGGDFALRRSDGVVAYQLAAALDLARNYREPHCPVGVVRQAFRPGQSAAVLRLDTVDPEQVDMLSLCIIGNATSRALGPYMLTPRGYERKRRPLPDARPPMRGA